jgi:hypothetical protein
MSNLARLFSNVSALFCAHEWARRVDGRRVYLECVHCLATTPGVEVDRKLVRPAAAVRRQNLPTAKAA